MPKETRKKLCFVYYTNGVKTCTMYKVENKYLTFTIKFLVILGKVYRIKILSNVRLTFRRAKLLACVNFSGKSLKTSSFEWFWSQILAKWLRIMYTKTDSKNIC